MGRFSFGERPGVVPRDRPAQDALRLTIVPLRSAIVPLLVN